MNKEPSNPNITQTKNVKKQNAEIGLDQNEQAMNGNYGMAETKEEDQMNEKG